MGKHRKALAAGAGVVAVVAAIALVLLPDRQPHYHGRTLEQWIELRDQLLREDANHRAIPETEIAIENIGTNAIPLALSWIAYQPQPSKTKQSVVTLVSMVPFVCNLGPINRWLSRDDPRKLRADAAVGVFDVLGPSAGSALPDLTRLANFSTDPGPARRAVDALADIGPAALPALLTVITNRNADARFYAVTSIASFGTNAIPAVPALILCLSDRAVDVAAVQTLGALKLQPELVVPALTNLVHDTDAFRRGFVILLLGDYGQDARLAVPTLLTALQDVDTNVRDNATNALERIAPDLLINTPAK